MSDTPWKPTRAQLDAARGKRIDDVWASDLDVVFVGINPSLYSAAVGHHFAHPGNRFWPALHRAGFTPRVLSPFEDELLPDFGCGVTNLVAHATARADELTTAALRGGATRLQKNVRHYKPRYVAIVGVTAYRTAFKRKHANVGPQREKIVDAALWVLPNPSGLNAHYQVDDLAAEFRALREAIRQ